MDARAPIPVRRPSKQHKQRKCEIRKKKSTKKMKESGDETNLIIVVAVSGSDIDDICGKGVILIENFQENSKVTSCRSLCLQSLKNKRCHSHNIQHQQRQQQRSTGNHSNRKRTRQVRWFLGAFEIVRETTVPLLLL